MTCVSIHIYIYLDFLALLLRSFLDGSICIHQKRDEQVIEHNDDGIHVEHEEQPVPLISHVLTRARRDEPVVDDEHVEQSHEGAVEGVEVHQPVIVHSVSVSDIGIHVCCTRVIRAIKLWSYQIGLVGF